MLKTSPRLKTMKTPAAPASKPAGASKNPLTEFQIMLTDLFSDWLLNGTTSQYSEALLGIFGRMQWARTFHNWHGGPEAAEAHASDSARRVYDNWQRKLVAGWPTEPVKAATPKPTTISERVRANTRYDVGKRLEEFRNEGTPEEIAFMSEVLCFWASGGHWSDGDRVEEVYIASAFHCVLENSGSVYVKVPEKMVPLIEQIVDAKLEAA